MGVEPNDNRDLRYAGSGGNTALAPDYYQRKTASTIEAAKILRQSLDRKNANDIVKQSIGYLYALPARTSAYVGVIGFSLGCAFALEAARSRSKAVKAVVLYYGTGDGEFNKAQAACLGHFAEKDLWGAHSQKVRALEKRLRAAGLSTHFYTYTGTQHWFAESDRPEYHPEAAALAWERTLGFLQEVL